jgi:hypothetical protein
MMYSSGHSFLAKKPASLASYNLSKRGGSSTDAMAELVTIKRKMGDWIGKTIARHLSK